MEFSRPEYWSGWLFPSPGNLPNPGIELRSPTLQADSLQAEPPGKPWNECLLLYAITTNIYLWHFNHGCPLESPRELKKDPDIQVIPKINNIKISDIGIFQSSPGDSNVHPSLRTPRVWSFSWPLKDLVRVSSLGLAICLPQRTRMQTIISVNHLSVLGWWGWAPTYFSCLVCPCLPYLEEL